MANLWDSAGFANPEVALTERLRSLSVGDVLRLQDGTMIKSIPMRHGAIHVRRYAVSRKGRDPLPRVGTKKNTLATAAEAASVALGGQND